MMLYYRKQRPFVVTEACNDWVDGCVVRWPQEAVDSTPGRFVYIHAAAMNARALAEALTKSSKTGVVATREPDFLNAFAQYECKSFRLALRVTNTKELEGLEHCSYSAVEVPNSMATHDLISRTHLSGKEIYVRIPKGDKTLQSRGSDLALDNFLSKEQRIHALVVRISRESFREIRVICGHFLI